MITLLLTGAALAAPPGYNVTKTGSSGCELSLGPAEADGVVPMRAECYWPEASLDKFKAVFGDWEKHDDVFSTVVESKVQRSEAGRALVYQKHRNSGIADREILLWMKSEQVDGWTRYSWTKAKGETLTVADGNVETPRSDGYWQAKASPDGGILVQHTLSYAPGGSVWGWVVRAFQTSGLEATVAEARKGVAP